MNNNARDPHFLSLIDQLLSSETAAFYDLHHHYPVGRQCEDVVDNVYPRLQAHGIRLSYGEVYDRYLAIKDGIAQTKHLE